MKGFKLKRGFTFFLLISHSLFLISSCTHLDLYEKNIPIPNYEWKSSFTAAGSFSIADTTSFYTIALVLRHTDAYRYNNIWLEVGIQNPGDTMFYQKVNLTLGNDASGWEGSGMNDIWELRKPLTTKPLPFKKAGVYNFSIKQIMRDDPLLYVMSAGLRIEKQENKN